MRDTPLAKPVRTLASELRSGSLSPVELLETLLQRIEDTEPRISAYSHVSVDRARDEAKAAERELRAGTTRGPLHGLPVTIKDLIETEGIPTTYGSPIYRGNVPNRDATVVRRLREAGAVIVGKATTHEFALGATTPPTRNPFDTRRIPGGSSGGSAAAVAAGSALMALGSDTGGSIRIPSSYCGVVGLKPTYGLVSRTGVFPESWSLDHIGPITRYVEDAALLLNVIAGYDPEDATTPRPSQRLPDYTAGIDAGVDGIKLGIPKNHFFDDLQPEVATAVRSAVHHLESMGVAVKELTFPKVDEMLASHVAIDLAEATTIHRKIYEQHFDSYLPETRRVIENGFFVRVTTYLDALRSRPRLLRDVLDAMAGVDVIAVPSQPIVAPLIGASTIDINGKTEDALSAMVRYLAPFNLTGQPAMTVCCGYTEGCPLGLQIIGRPFDDVNVLRVGHAYQTSTAWLQPLLDMAVPGASAPDS